MLAFSGIAEPWEAAEPRDASLYGGYADELARTVNAKQRIAGDALYSDGLQLFSTTLAAPAASGDATINVAGVAPFTVGEPLALDYLNGARKEVRKVTAVGTAGADGTGVTLAGGRSGSIA